MSVFAKMSYIRAHKDFYNKLKYVYGYDAIGRLIRTDKTGDGSVSYSD